MSYIFNRSLIILGLRPWHKWYNTYSPDKINIQNTNVTENHNSENQIELTNNQTQINYPNINNEQNINYTPSKNNIIDINIEEGINLDIIKKELERLDLITDIDSQKEEQNLDSHNKKYSLIFTLFEVLYHILIFCIILFKPLTSLVKIILDDFNYIPPSFFFSLIIPIEYILGIIYFNDSHFDKFYLNDSNSQMLKCIPNTKIIIVSILIVSLIVSILLSIFKILDIDYDENVDIFNYNQQNIYFKVLINIFDFIYTFFGQTSLLINIISFMIVFCKHIKIIDAIITIIDKKMLNDCDIKTLSFVCRQVTRIRYELHCSIKLLENIFSSQTIIGAISIGYIIETYGEYSISQISLPSVIIFSIIQILFFYIIYVVNNQKEHFLELVNSPSISRKFLSRYNYSSLNNYDINYQNNDQNLSDYLYEDNNNEFQRMINIEKDNATSIDWLILNDIINQRWTEFSVFGISLQDGTILKQGVLLCSFIVLINKSL